MDKKKLTVYKANKLVEASYSAISLSEQTILLACIASQDPRKLTAETPVYLTVSAFADLADITHGDVYNDLKEAAERLFGRYVVIDAPDPDNPRLSRTRTRWVSAIDYFDDEGRLRIYFSPRILPYLAQLKGQFTKYKLQYVAEFRSVYGIRLYELLVQWQSKGEREIEVEWLREHWGLEDKYPRIGDLKQYVIEPAMRDVNTYSNLWVTMGQRKVGRRIVAFQFRFGLKPTAEARAKLETGETAIPKRLTRRYVEQHARPGESYDAAYTRLRRERDEQRRTAASTDQGPPKRKRRQGRHNTEELRKMRAQLALDGLDHD